ncbi:hypothetical protein ACSYAD_32735 [Acaryochloris marina NIES-2412]|uniref:hypothetical protein n=1 Tax=Acaryochloris marina TaxID=155978 RepID=UPI00405A0905
MLKPPSLLAAAKTITEVDRLIPVKTSDCIAPRQCKLIVDSSRSIAADFGGLEGRLLHYLQATGKLPSSFDYDLQGIVDLHRPIMQSPIIATPCKGYTNHKLRGMIMIGKTESSQQRAFISLQGEQVEDDHYPYYEGIFAIEQNGKTVQYLEGQRFFFDIAGLEGFEGLPMIILLFVPLILIFGCVPIAIIVIVNALWSYLRSLRPFR